MDTQWTPFLMASTGYWASHCQLCHLDIQYYSNDWISVVVPKKMDKINTGKKL